MYKLVFVSMFYYAPNFEEIEGAYWFGAVHASISVRASVTLCIQSRTVRDRILKFNIWNVHEK